MAFEVDDFIERVTDGFHPDEWLDVVEEAHIVPEGISCWPRDRLGDQAGFRSRSELAIQLAENAGGYIQPE